MDKRNRLENAMDDLRAIRSVLDDTGGSFVALAPVSRALGGCGAFMRCSASRRTS